MKTALIVAALLITVVASADLRRRRQPTNPGNQNTEVRFEVSSRQINKLMEQFEKVSTRRGELVLTGPVEMECSQLDASTYSCSLEKAK